MGKRGPKTKPTALKLIEGNRGHRPLPENEPQPTPDMPPMPAHLDATARAEWERVAPELWATGVLTVIDGAALGAYCTAFSVWARAEYEIQKGAKVDDSVLSDGLLQKTKSGNIIQNPLLGIANVARRDMVRLAAELGLTPSSRANLEGRKRGDEDPTDKKFFA
jgi:P27 family predicted phage terminase small subunit